MKTILKLLKLFSFLFMIIFTTRAQNIHESAREGYLDTVKILLEKNIQLINLQDETGRTPLHWASREVHVEVIKYLIEKVSQDPISVKKLNATGDDVMSQLNATPGPKIGHILDILLGYVLNDPKKNSKKWLLGKIKELGKCDIATLEKMSQKARKEREGLEMKRDKMTKKKYWVT